MIPATSTPRGQRTVHAWQVAQNHKKGLRIAVSILPTCRKRRTFRGVCAVSKATGHPKEQRPHWTQQAKGEISLEERERLMRFRVSILMVSEKAVTPVQTGVQDI